MIPIILPLLAVILPGIVIVRSRTKPVRTPFKYSIGSFACGFGALLQELWVVYRRAIHNDFGGIEDTIGAVFMISVGIVIVTLSVNFAALYLSDEHKK